MKSFKYIIVVSLLFIVQVSMAQFDTIPVEELPPIQDVPIDGGVSILIALGAGLGIWRNMKKKV